MKILHVTREQAADRRYGLGKSLAPIIQAMQRRGHTVRYFFQDDLSSTKHLRWDACIRRLKNLPGIRGRTHREALVTAWGERLKTGWLAARLAAHENFSHIHLHDPWLALGFLLGKHRYRLRSVRWGLTEHGFGCYSQATHDDGLRQGNRMQRWLRRIEAHTLAHADWVIAPTQASLVALTRDLTLPTAPQHWHCIPHARPVITPTDKAEAKKTLGWPAGQVWVVAVGRIVPLKQFDKILSACIALSERFPELHLQILGEGPRESLEAQARQFGFEDRLHIAVTDRIEDYLAAADIYVSLSTTESFGLANLEALCAGLPSICSAVGGVPEVTGNGAWLIPGNETILARCLTDLLEHSEIRRSWEMLAQKHAADWPDSEQICDAYLAIYQA